MAAARSRWLREGQWWFEKQQLLWFLHGWNVIELLGLALCAVLKGSQLHSALVLYDHLGGTVDDVRAQVPGLDAAMPYLSSVAAATPAAAGLLGTSVDFGSWQFNLLFFFGRPRLRFFMSCRR